MWLETLDWLTARDVLAADPVIVIPLGGAAKEHGPHLPLGNDRLLAEGLARRLDAVLPDLVFAPTMTYSHYPAFEGYAGSVSIGIDTAAALVIDTCRSLARFGPRRFYVLNTGLSTRHPLSVAARVLTRDGLAFAYTDIRTIGEPAEGAIAEQAAGSHADELETSKMLILAPEVVHMDKAVADTRADVGFGPRVRPTGVFGDATLASAAKGERIVAQWITNLRRDIAELSVR